MKRVLVLFLCICMFCPIALADESDIQYLTSPSDYPTLALDGLLEVHLIDVEAADSILLRMGTEAVLIDSGRERNYERILTYFQSIGVSELKYVIATHPHDDHIGGFIGVLDVIPTSVYYKAPLYEQFESVIQKKLQKVLKEKQIPEQYVTNGQQMTLGGATLTFYQYQNAKSSQNNRSMVIKVQYGQRSILLSADVEGNAQKALAAEYGDALRADILKMPHHGIGTYQKSFHDAVQASLGTVSNFKNSAQKTIDVMVKRGMKWKLTTRGTIVMVTDGILWDVWQLPNQK